MSQTIHSGATDAASSHNISGKGLKTGQLGLLAVVVLGISTIAPAYTLTGAPAPPSAQSACSFPPSSSSGSSR